jgi:hypothetical protein
VRLFAIVLLALGMVLTLATAAHGATAYQAIAAMDAASRLDTPNPLALFSDMTATGIKVNNQVDPRNRGAYSDALTQLVLDGTGVCIGLAFIAAGLFLRLNE